MAPPRAAAPRAPAPPKPLLVTVDVVIFTLRDASALEVLLVRRKYPPFAGRWAVPGGFVLEHESLDDAAERELREETGVADVYLEQLHAFGEPRRDPRGRVVTVAYYALVAAGRLPLKAGSDAADARWFDAGAPPALAFDHRAIFDFALARLRAGVEGSALAFRLLPPTFTLTELQRVHEAVLGRPLDKRNFRRRALSLGLVRPLREWRREGQSRPAQLFRPAALPG
ncbi:MAG TPA: NUDIX domain-containing protein [Polyangiaceae bacterium]|nr:NUDIX domain-containing protein [Polyangiaceae bacterium]